MPREKLNEFQQRRLATNCRYMDSLLSDIEQVLQSSRAKTPFPKYVLDLSPAQIKVVEDHIARLRAQLVRVLAGQDIVVDPPRISAVHSLRTALGFAEIAIEELRPESLKGYGQVPKEAAEDLNGIVSELQALVTRFDRYLAEEHGQDLRAKLEAVQASPDLKPLLGRLEEIITRHGLVEFRPTLTMILDKLTDPSFEIAVFGRVSAGKSSLLNAILGREVLPVGVTPITAVPTRVASAASAALQVWFADRRVTTLPLDVIAEYVTEQGNPGNSKRVSRVLAQVPTPELPPGFVFVDTPGLGSLATSGTEETLAYLPRCDLGIVLIVAGSTFEQEDLDTVRALYEARIPVRLLLSKADLLPPLECAKLITYVQQTVRDRLGLQLEVTPLSVLPEHRSKLKEFVQRELRPLYARAQEMRSESIGRKVEGLRSSVRTALLTMCGGMSQESAPPVEAEKIEAALRQAAGQFTGARNRCLRMTEFTKQLEEEVLTRIVNRLWSDPVPAAGGLDALVHELAGELSLEVRSALSQAAAIAVRTLRQAADSLAWKDRPGEDELLQSLREMPRLDLSESEPSPAAPSPAAWAGEAFGKWRLRQSVDPLWKQRYRPAFARFLDALQSWAQAAAQTMQQDYEEYASAYRAQIQRLLASRDTKADVSALRADAERLQEYAPEARRAARSAGRA
jgi:GTP-binding protein EngB required for normal cell division